MQRLICILLPRARGSQIGAHASLQSQPLKAPKDLADRVSEIEARFKGQEIPRPSHWSGFRLSPDRFEFWQEGTYRLHEREVFKKSEQGDGWTHEYLYP